MNTIYDGAPRLAVDAKIPIKKAERIRFLKTFNKVRALHSLPPVAYDSDSDRFTDAAAVLMAGTGRITHYPRKGMPCFSPNAAYGARMSNLYIGSHRGQASLKGSDQILASWLIDKGVKDIGHRRWILNPFLKSIAFSRFDTNSRTAAVLRVVDTEEQKQKARGFVAYPVGNYPAVLFDKNWYLSFGVIADQYKRSSNDKVRIKLNDAKIRVSNEAGQVMNVYDQSVDYGPVGMPNSLQWKLKNLKTGVRYSVSISGVKVYGRIKQYKYGFTIKE